MHIRVDEIVIGIGSLAVLGANVLAQAVPSAIPDMPAVPGMNWNSLTAQGMLAWYAWYVTTRAMPKFVADGRAERDQERLERAKHNEALLTALKSCTDALATAVQFCNRDQGPQSPGNRS